MLEQPQRHRDTKTSQSHPPSSQRRGAEAQRRRGDLTGFLRVARFRPSNGREPLGRATAPNTSVHLGVPAQRLALIKRKPRHFLFFIHVHPQLTREKKGRTDVPLARRPVGSRASRKACFLRWPASHRRQAIRSPVVLPSINGTAFQTQQPHLCVFASLRLCASAFLFDDRICVYLRDLRFLRKNEPCSSV